ncbi:hypothetical protein QJS10_CPA10g00734 [Acorus calamus]|uniref:Ataxin-10 domain-containing protein n=1 Tax=Acorus calamus TaxID=4465 RepID=A0AAV9DX54_ACOCL|nr:hypothetical protein QJS10_CPA10g00734 [Acorus calamus]
MEAELNSGETEDHFRRILASTIPSTTASTDEEALQILIDSSRTSHGRSALSEILPTVLRLLRSLPDHHPFLLPSLRLIRNLCAGDASNQNSFLLFNGVDEVSSLILGDADPQIVRAGLQVLGNVSLAGEDQRDAVWGRLFPKGLWELARVRDRCVADPLCMIIYTCCDNRGRLIELSGDQGLSIVSDIIKTASEDEFREDWLPLLLSKISLEESYFPLLFDKLGSADGITSEQAFLVRLLAENLDQRFNEVAISDAFSLAVLKIVDRASRAINFVSRGTSSLPTGDPAIDVLGYSLIILRNICAREDLPQTSVDSLILSGLIRLLLGLLRDLEPPTNIRTVLKNSDVIMKACPYSGFRRDVVAVLGNCAFRRKQVQDEIRNENGILLLLQQCSVCDENPFSREWAIWAMRNVFEGNEDNQNEISKLECQGAVDNPCITELGLRVEWDQNSGRARLVNITT